MASTSTPGSKSHRCEYCQKEFAYKYRLNVHRKIHLMKSEFNCSFCDYVTNFKKHLFLHIRTHIQERPYKCQWPNCNAAFRYTNVRDYHQKMVHRKDDETLKIFQCSKCPYKTGYKSDLPQHLKTNPNVKEFCCDLCPFQTKHKSSLKSHHQIMHLKLKPFKCQQLNCTSAFRHKSHLKHHQIVHNKENESLLKFKCSECDYKTGRQRDLKMHLVVHSEVKPFGCDLCPFRSKHKKIVKQHVHSTFQQFKCPELNCSFSGKRKSNLTKHMKVHADYKEFGCTFPQCNFRTRLKDSLKAHEMTHRGEKPFKCSFCSFKSTFKSNLSVHIRTHTGEAPYPCPTCPFRKTSGELKVHVQRRHVGK